jgi:dihydrofolate reductase
MSLDGVVQDPAGDEGLRVGGWVGLIKDRPEVGKLALDEARRAEAVSSTLKDPDWSNSTVLEGDPVHAVSSLKQELAGEIVVAASFRLARTLIEHDLVDELRLRIYPVVLGAGERIFGDTGDKKPLRLVGSQTVDDGVVFLTYEVVPRA